MPTESPDSIIAQHFLNMIPKEILAVYQVLAKLKYPISDKHALNLAVEEQSKSEANGADVSFITRLFTACDFSLDSPRNAMDKLSERLLSLAGVSFRVPPSSRFPERPFELRELPLEPDFGDDFCGNLADQHYRDRIDQGDTNAAAIRSALLARGRCRQWLRWFALVQRYPNWYQVLTDD